LNTYQTKDVTIRVACEPASAGRFVQMQVAIMMRPEHAAQLVEAVRAINAEVPGEEDPGRMAFVDGVTRELAEAASSVASGKTG